MYKRPNSLKNSSHYCPGCGHGIIHRLVCEVIDELQIQDRTIGVAPIGCAVLIYNYIDVDFIEPPHGRAPATATGIKRLMPDHVVFTYQGDGDLASIGAAEIIHAANRGEKITVIFINNGVYGMTGGQMAPTTLMGAKTTTSPTGRGENFEGNPIRMSEMLAVLDTPAYIERTTMITPQHIRKTKQAIKKAFQNQIENKCFSLVEVISNCPTNWKMNISQSIEYIKNVVLPVYPLGVIKS
jgi:2-oxoglutarate/2-oxoacid ferredoxin oxidoreductase subunit beta